MNTTAPETNRPTIDWTKDEAVVRAAILDVSFSQEGTLQLRTSLYSVEHGLLTETFLRDPDRAEKRVWKEARKHQAVSVFERKENPAFQRQPTDVSVDGIPDDVGPVSDERLAVILTEWKSPSAEALRMAKELVLLRASHPPVAALHAGLLLNVKPTPQQRANALLDAGCDVDYQIALDELARLYTLEDSYLKRVEIRASILWEAVKAIRDNLDPNPEETTGLRIAGKLDASNIIVKMAKSLDPVTGGTT